MNAIGAFRCALSVFVLAYGVRNVSAIGLFCDAIFTSTLSQTPRFCVTQDQIGDTRTNIHVVIYYKRRCLFIAYE